MKGPAILPVVHLPGLRPNSVGNYLAALGLLRIASRKRPHVRGAYRSAAFCLVGGPSHLEELTALVWDVGAKGEWSGYHRSWTDALADEKNRKPGSPSPLWRHSSAISESEAILCAAHVVATGIAPQTKEPGAWRFFNPLLGLGGTVGRRDFAKGWNAAQEKVKEAARSYAEHPITKTKNGGRKPKVTWSQDKLRNDLVAFLTGGSCQCLDAWNAASWFSGANKAYNSGQGWYTEGQITPWAMLLACEGLPFLAGSPSRRLGARAVRFAAFPFVSRAAAPRTQGEAGRNRAEIWLPIWSRPMTVAEVRLLFLRGRAEIGGTGASTPAAFAAAILRRGVDAGIDGFQRYVLGRTTTDQVFESRLDRFIPSPRYNGWHAEIARSQAVTRVLDLCDRLPRDFKRGQRWQFRGLRGPVEAALVEFAAEPENPERGAALLDSVVEALDGVDRNREHRKFGVRWNPLPAAWLPTLFGPGAPVVEARLAMAVASIGRRENALLVHRFGLAYNTRNRSYAFPERMPHTRTWGNRPLAENLAMIVRRRLIDAEQHDSLPFAPSVRVEIADASAWLEGRVDPVLLECWLSRLVLFDWQQVPSEVFGLFQPRDRPIFSGSLALFTLLRPLLEPRDLRLPSGEDLLPIQSGARNVTAARQIVSLLGTGNVDHAVRAARARYYMARQPLARTWVEWSVTDPERLLAALLIPVNRAQLGRGTDRWLRPCLKQGVAR